MESKIISTGYTGKIKTGSQKPKKKFDTPKPKVSNLETLEKKPRKRKDDIKQPKTFEKWNKENFLKEPPKDTMWIHSIEQDISKKKEQLSWRKVTKKSQRSFSKNKEREYLSSKPRFDKDTEVGRGPFSNTFEKKSYIESNEKWSSWDPKSKKPGTGFEKSKTGYKGVWAPWDRSAEPKKSTRTWDDDSKKSTKTYDEKPKKSFPKPSFEKKIEKSIPTKSVYIAPKPTWEKETDTRDKKKIKDPTK